MPIRTRRGRAAAYRAVWEWPLHSPARLIGCLVVLVVVVALLSALAGTLGPSTGSRGDGALPPARPARSAPATGGAAPPPELNRAPLPVTAVPPTALTVATRWTQAWATHPAGTTVARWTGGLAPYTTPEYLGVLDSVDPANVPGTRITGPPQAVEVKPDSVRIQVPTDAARLELLLIQVAPGDWRVSGYDRAS